VAQCAPSHRGPAGLDPYEFHAFHHALKQVRVNRYCKKFQEPSNLKELCIDVFVEGTTCNRPQGIDPWSLPNSIHHPVRTVPVGEMRQRNGAGGKALHLRFPAFFQRKFTSIANQPSSILPSSRSWDSTCLCPGRSHLAVLMQRSQWLVHIHINLSIHRSK